MAKKHFDGALAKKILVTIGKTALAGGIITTLLVAPGMGLVLRELADIYRSSDRRTQFRMRKTFIELRRKRLITSKRLSNGETIMVLSERGKKMVLRYQFMDIALPRPSKWDGTWRFVIFDFPKKYHKEREVFRAKLKACNFYQLQKSVWITPFSCRNEIDFISEYLGVSPYVRIVEANDFDGSFEAREHFDL